MHNIHERRRLTVEWQGVGGALYVRKRTEAVEKYFYGWWGLCILDVRIEYRL